MAKQVEEGSWSASLKLSHLLRHNREELLFIAAEPLRAPAVAVRRLAMKMRHEKPLAYIGWIGHRNLGDEVMFEVIRKSLSRFPVTHFAPPAGEALMSRAGLGGPDFFRAVLLGGGTLINPLFLNAARVAQSYGAPFHTVGTGVGSPGFGMPLHASLEGWPEVLRSSLVSVRGPYSEALLREAGIGHATVIGDPALGLTPERRPSLRTRRRLIVNLALEPGAKPSLAESKSFASAAAIAKQFIRDGGEVVGVALGNGDRSALTDFRAEYCLQGMTIQNHRVGAERFLRTLEGSIGLIGVRLHSAVMASCLGVPSILIAYRNKCVDFMASMDMEIFAVGLGQSDSPKQIAQRWDRINNEPELGGFIYQKALFWKGKQKAFYGELAERVLAEG